MPPKHSVRLPDAPSFQPRSASRSLSFPPGQATHSTPSAPEDWGSLPDQGAGCPSQQAAESVIPSGGSSGKALRSFSQESGNAVSYSTSPNWICHCVRESMGLFSFSLQHVTEKLPNFLSLGLLEFSFYGHALSPSSPPNFPPLRPKLPPHAPMHPSVSETLFLPETPSRICSEEQWVCILFFTKRGSLMLQRVDNPPAMQKTQEMRVRSLGREEPLEMEEMATHSSLPARKHPWTEKPGRRESFGSQELDMTEQLNVRVKLNSPHPPEPRD